ncbi:MAG: PKD domain-containing protein [Bacteroidales bacterium]
MKTILVVLFFLVYTNLFSQPGKDCSNPYVINAIPFTLNGQTTQGYGNDYNETMACNSLYMSGNDFVFAYTPNSNINITIKLTNTSVLVGLFILDGCPDQPTTHCIAKNEAPNGNPKLSNIPLTANHTYYIIVDTYNAANLFPSTGFSINVDESHNIDVAAIWLFKPKSGCHLNTQTQMLLVYRNFGTQAIDTVICGYQIDDNPPVLETSIIHLNTNQEFYYSFHNSADLSLVNHVYKIKMFVHANNDENPLNDTITKWIYHSDVVSSFPFFTDFENDNGGFHTQWISDQQQGTSWEWGQPTAPIINHAASGNKCWATNLSGNYLSPEDSYILTPCFDFSSLTLPIVEFDLWYETAITDIAQLEYSIDSGDTWHRVGNTGEGMNWYNTPSGYSEMGWNGSTGGWVHAQHTLDGLGGKTNVLLRISFRGGVNGTNEGIAIDNFKISESPQKDVSINTITYPYDSCGLSNNEKIKIKLTNNGLEDIHHFPIFFSFDNGNTYIQEEVIDTLSFNESIIYTSNTSFNFSNTGIYPVIIYCNLTDDQNHLNDTLKTSIINFPTITLYPYIEDFENNNGFWYANGLHNSWQWGQPNDTVLNQAFSGNNIWATNLSGYHNLAEESYVSSPCFDLSSLNNPIFKANIWYQLTYPSYCQLQVNTKHSTIWNTLGSASDPNWYNSGYSWTENSNGWKQVKHSLKDYTNNTIKMRFYFKGTIQNTGFAFDKIEICNAPKADFTEIIPTKAGYYVKFNNQSQDIDSCLWNFGDGTFSKELSPTHQYPNADSVLVTLTVWNSCDIDSIKKYVHPLYISIPENQLNDCIQAYTNMNYLYIINNCSQHKAIISVYNIYGQELYSNQLFLEKNLNKINLNNLNINSFYIIKIKNENGIIILKSLITE